MVLGLDERGSLVAFKDGVRVCGILNTGCLQSPAYRVFFEGNCLLGDPCCGHLICEKHARDCREGKIVINESKLTRVESI